MKDQKLKKPSNPKERSLLKGAIRRVFSRSELRRRALDAAQVKDYQDPSRKRVTRWGKCAACQNLEPLYKMQIDHKDPIIPVGETLEDQSWDKVIDRVWCDERLLQALCKPCHDQKTKAENAERRRLKKEKK
jgi:5-methylcytosine-specific restriction endonuclease McrA